MPYAVTPYNFVPLSDRIVRADPPPDADAYHTDLYTGWMDLTIHALTPLYTRGAIDIDSEHPTDETCCFSYPDGRHALPGSSLRGMIRSLFEIITESRLEYVSPRHLFFRSFAAGDCYLRRLYSDPTRFDKQKLRGGQLIEMEGRMVLRVSKSVIHGFVLVANTGQVASLTHRERTEFKEPVAVKVRAKEEEHRMIGVQFADFGSGDSGWLIVPGKDVTPRRRWFQVILNPDTNFEEFAVPQDVYDDYLAWGSMAHGKRFEAETDAGQRKAPRKLKAGSPAFALVDVATKQVQTLGATMMMHLRYEWSIDEVAARSTAQPGNSIHLDMAQTLFGRVRDLKTGSKTDQVSGRVFFEDARCDLEPAAALLNSRGPVCSVLLSGPKPTAFQIYLADQRHGDLTTWDSDEAHISGRKMYWHRSAAAATHLLASAPPAISESQVTRIQPLREDVTFAGRVRFENLSPVEFGALYASIQLPPDLAHKFGMGKNLGLGSIRIETNVTLLDSKKRFSSLNQSAGVRSTAEVHEALKSAYTSFVHRLHPRATSLWHKPRMLALAQLLSWAHKPDDHDTMQMGFEGTVLHEQWRDRWPLSPIDRLVKLPSISDVLPVRNAAPPIERQAQAPRYQPGQKVQGKVIDAVSGTVELDDDSIVRRVSGIGHLAVGEKATFKVLDVARDGHVTRLGR